MSFHALQFLIPLFVCPRRARDIPSRPDSHAHGAFETTEFRLFSTLTTVASVIHVVGNGRRGALILAIVSLLVLAVGLVALYSRLHALVAIYAGARVLAVLCTLMAAIVVPGRVYAARCDQSGWRLSRSLIRRGVLVFHLHAHAYTFYFLHMVGIAFCRSDSLPAERIMMLGFGLAVICTTPSIWLAPGLYTYYRDKRDAIGVPAGPVSGNPRGPLVVASGACARKEGGGVALR